MERRRLRRRMAFGIRRRWMTSSHQVVWYENSAWAPEWKRHHVGKSLRTGLDVRRSRRRRRLDVIASGCAGGDRSQERSAGSRTAAIHRENGHVTFCGSIRRRHPSSSSTYDGQLDIAACSEAGTAYWWRNLGPEPSARRSASPHRNCSLSQSCPPPPANRADDKTRQSGERAR
jgi:hypothetical protein